MTEATEHATMFQVYRKVIQLSIHIYSFSYSFPYRLLQDIGYSFLCYIVGPYCLSVLYTVSTNPKLLTHPFPSFSFGNHKIVFLVCESLSDF